jgi:tetratricopeptide (TPR) repeat protein
MFRRLAVFPGSWMIRAAETICAGDDVRGADALGLVSSLVDQSLVVFEGGERESYRMLETIREYARERLRDAGEVADVERRHTDHVLSLAEAAEADPASTALVEALEAASDDVAAAVHRAVRAKDRLTLLRLVGALGWYWATWRPREGRHYVEVAMAVGDHPASRELGAALRASVLADSYTPTETTRSHAWRSIKLCERFDDAVGAAKSRLLLAFVERQLGGSCAAALALTDAAAAALAEHGDSWGEALAALTNFRLHLHCGSLPSALAAGHDALRRFSTLGDPWGTPWTRIWLAVASRMHGDADDATRLCQQALADSNQRLPYITCLAHAELAGLRALRGQHERALDHSGRARDNAAVSGVADAAGIAANVAGFNARLSGRTADARGHHLEALAVFRDVGSDIGVAHSLCGLGFAQLCQGELDGSRRHLREALRIAIQTRRLELVAAALEGLACVAADSDPRLAATCLGAARATRDTTAIRVSLIEGDEPAATERHVRAALDTRSLRAAWRDGERATFEDLLDLLPGGSLAED